jgi:hypothetical protein
VLQVHEVVKYALDVPHLADSRHVPSVVIRDDPWQLQAEHTSVFTDLSDKSAPGNRARFGWQLTGPMSG